HAVDARVVELDALPDAVGAGAEDEHLPAVAPDRLVLALVVGRVEVGRPRLELAGARVHDAERRAEAEGLLALAADVVLGDAVAEEEGDLLVGEPVLLGLQHEVAAESL